MAYNCNSLMPKRHWPYSALIFSHKRKAKTRQSCWKQAKKKAAVSRGATKENLKVKIRRIVLKIFIGLPITPSSNLNSQFQLMSIRAETTVSNSLRWNLIRRTDRAVDRKSRPERRNFWALHLHIDGKIRKARICLQKWHNFLFLYCLNKSWKVLLKSKY